MSGAADPMKIVASPTKGFFIYMLTRDIELARAIVDLVDNCVDGAIRLRGDGPYNGLEIELEATPTEFRIADNCGGIEADLARTYAFRFGRPPDFQEIPHSVGQFGVGMKRALFKLGNRFRITSAARRSRFTVDIDVDEWKALVDWEFRFSMLQEGADFPDVPEKDRGTQLTVGQLHSAVAEQFSLENFQAKLAEEISSAHQRNLAKGLRVSLNGVSLSFRPLEVMSSDRLLPAVRQVIYGADTMSPVRVRIYVGVADSTPSEAGWYVFCNGRLILKADKTETTGWGFESETGIPRYHNQYAMFRGYVFFDADKAEELPWNTTKSGIDADSRLYQSVLLQMISLMKPVITFLNRLKEEKEGRAGDGGPLQEAIDRAETKSIDDMAEADLADAFRSPKAAPRPPGPRLTVISYRKPSDQVERTKKSLKVRSNREAGEGTFDYYYKREVEE